jgi:hypothetical protein
MSTASYAPPLDQFFNYGDCNKLPQEWANYVEELGLTEAHIPELIRLAIDKELHWGYADDPATWAPIHAIRALGQLQAEAAIDPLLKLLSDVPEEDDWTHETIPKVLGMIGAPAIPALSAYLAEPSHNSRHRVSAATSLQEIGKQHPEARDACVAVLTQQLERFNRNSLELNGFLIAELLDLAAVEAAPIMQKAFAARRVDLFIAGDWNDVQVELGLKSRDELPRRHFNPFLGRMTGDIAMAAMPYDPQTTGFGKPVPDSKKSNKKKKKK